MSKNYSSETDFKARLIGTLSDRDVSFQVYDTKRKKVVDEFESTTKNGQIDVSFNIQWKSIYRVRVSSYGMLTHAFLLEITPGHKVEMGNIQAYLGDANGDNVIDKRDLDLIVLYKGVKAGTDRWTFGDIESARAGENCDFNGDKVVDGKDYKIAFDNLGKRGSLK